MPPKTNVETNVETNVIDIFAAEGSITSIKADKKSSPAKAKSSMAHFYSLSLDELSRYQALLYSLTLDQSVLTPEFKFICELVSLEANTDLAVSSAAQVTALMEVVFTTKWLKKKEIPNRKKNNKDSKVNHALIRKYVDDRLVRLKQPLKQEEEVNRKAFIFNSALRDDFSKWVIDTDAKDQLSLIGGSVSSSSSWLSSLPTKVVDCIHFHYGYNVVKKKKDKANGLMGINFMPGMEDPTYILFSGAAFTPISE